MLDIVAATGSRGRAAWGGPWSAAVSLACDCRKAAFARPWSRTPCDWTERSLELSRLLGRAGLGDRAAFATLYERTSPHLFAVVLRINRDRAQAEDILQEVYVNVWRAAGGFDAAQSQPLTWLTSIARNRAIDSLRRSRTQPQIQSPGSIAGGADAEDDSVYDTVADSAPGPLDLLEPGRRRARARRLHGEAVRRCSGRAWRWPSSTA